MDNFFENNINVIKSMLTQRETALTRVIVNSKGVVPALPGMSKMTIYYLENSAHKYKYTYIERQLAPYVGHVIEMILPHGAIESRVSTDINAVPKSVRDVLNKNYEHLLKIKPCMADICDAAAQYPNLIEKFCASGDYHLDLRGINNTNLASGIRYISDYGILYDDKNPTKMHDSRQLNQILAAYKENCTQILAMRGGRAPRKSK